MLISIIIPHRNSYFDLVRCVKSIPDLNCIEVIIIDDNSDIQLDRNSIDILKRETNVSVFTLNKNMGAGYSRNVGLKKAKGKWIVFADADDYFLNSFNEIINKLYDTQCDLHYFKVDSRCSLTGEISDRHLMWNEMLEFENENNLRYTHVVPWGKVISRNVIKENSIFFDEIMYSNDITFSTKVGYFSKKVKIHNLICYCVTKQPNTLHSNFSGQAVFSRMIANINRNFFLYRINHTKYKTHICPFLKNLIKGGYIRLFLLGSIYLLKCWASCTFYRKSKLRL